MLDACMAEGASFCSRAGRQALLLHFLLLRFLQIALGMCPQDQWKNPSAVTPDPGHGKLRPKAAEQQRPCKLKPPDKTGGCRPLPARTVGGTNHKAKKGNSLTAVRAFPDGCQGMA